ncbi:hypothetical protein Srot_0193 [Segniliparus rotundus DSM 44985]|uniref:Lipoprotein n=1 Tax=Segniliparus rotundus (strain ATCC BAA-972 / CDC 1076 / CIP 108378 / DSM 44985 / JCM 13578) TaxID=640132 RepID=D6ZAE0_SEGRD|nr:hypothetical protein [Segniliparus rotundus]ADG96682.1 hypothetical protein Srot_0193 [Segniliparus rotundus DSM 44985]
MNIARRRPVARAWSAGVLPGVVLALTGACGAAAAVADVRDVCDEGQRGVVDVKNSMQSFVEALGEYANATDEGKAERAAVGKFAWLAENSLRVAASRLDSVSSFSQPGPITEKSEELVHQMRLLFDALGTNDYAFVDPVIDGYNDAAVGFMAACTGDPVGGDEA